MKGVFLRIYTGFWEEGQENYRMKHQGFVFAHSETEAIAQILLERPNSENVTVIFTGKVLQGHAMLMLWMSERVEE